MRNSTLKLLIKAIIKEALSNEVLGGGQGMTPEQQKVVDLLQKRSFEIVKYVPNADKTMSVVLQRLYGKGKHGGPRFAVVGNDGLINQDKLDVNKFLQIVGESMTTRAELDSGVMKAVNVEEETGTGAVAGYATPYAFKKTKEINETLSPESHVGQGFFKLDDKTAKELAGDHPSKPGYEMLVPAPEGLETTKGFAWLSQRIVNGKQMWVIRDSKNWILKDGKAILSPMNEMSTSGDAGAYMTKNAFTKNKTGSQKALDVTKKMGFKVVGPAPRV